MTKKTKDTKQDKPIEGFNDLVKTMLNTPPEPKGKKDGKRKSANKDRGD